jgi:acetamidase/formamidase
MTGPVKVSGAKPGDVLMVEVLSATPWVPWGWNAIRKGKGALGNSKAYGFDAHEGGTVVVPLDLERMTFSLPWARGAESSFDAFGGGPFFGQLGVAPALDRGTVSSIIPGVHGGNLDDKLLRAGSVVYFRVENEGALFSAGDGHAVQGDGEFCVTALETSLEGRFRLTVLSKDDSPFGEDGIDVNIDTGKLAMSDAVYAVFANLTTPRAETETHYISMAFHEDLDVAIESALVDLIAWTRALTGASPESAYRTASLVADAGIPQVVNGLKTVRLAMPKSVVKAMRDAKKKEDEKTSRREEL